MGSSPCLLRAPPSNHVWVWPSITMNNTDWLTLSWAHGLAISTIRHSHLAPSVLCTYSQTPHCSATSMPWLSMAARWVALLRCVRLCCRESGTSGWRENTQNNAHYSAMPARLTRCCLIRIGGVATTLASPRTIAKTSLCKASRRHAYESLSQHNHWRRW